MNVHAGSNAQDTDILHKSITRRNTHKQPQNPPLLNLSHYCSLPRAPLVALDLLLGDDITEDSKGFTTDRDVAAPPPSSQPGFAGAPAPPAPSVNDGATSPGPAAPSQQLQKKKKKGRHDSDSDQKKGRPPKKAPDRGPSSASGLSTPPQPAANAAG